MAKRLFVFGFVFVCSWFMVGCVVDEAHALDLKIEPPVAHLNLVPELRPGLDLGPGPDPIWRPRAHPPGTLLEDGAGELWMVENWLERRLVSGDDILGEVGLNEVDAIPMSAAEEHCIVPLDDEYWYPRSTGWYEYYSPVFDEVTPSEDSGLWLLSWDRHLRRRSSPDALKSWGFSPWIDDFDEYDGDWSSFRPIGRPLGFRDGSMFLTERDEYYYMIDDVAWRIDPVLAVSAGYHLGLATRTLHDRFFHQTRLGGELVREIFAICPTLEPIGEYPDADGDGSASVRDCDDRNASVSPLAHELCNGIDDNCDGLVDDVETCLAGAP